MDEKNHRSPSPGPSSSSERGTELTTETETATSAAKGAPTEKSETSSDATRFEAIRPATTATAPRHRLSSETVSTLRRERTNNGWGVDDLEEDGAGSGSVIAPYNLPSPSAEHDPFEVGWDGGDSDPLCPRSMPTWRKWLIIAITSVGSFCVYVRLPSILLSPLPSPPLHPNKQAVQKKN